MQEGPTDNLGKLAAAICCLLIVLRFILAYKGSMGTTEATILYLFFIIAVVAVVLRYR